MDLPEMQSGERMSREDAARRLHVLADHLAQHNELTR
jgi:hypothetical protein